MHFVVGKRQANFCSVMVLDNCGVYGIIIQVSEIAFVSIQVVIILVVVLTTLQHIWLSQISVGRVM